MAKTQGPRAAASTVLAALTRHHGSLSRLLPRAAQQLDSRDRALMSELCYGVCRFYPRLQALVSPLVKKPLKIKDRDIECLLLLGCYQLDYMRIPDHAAISETVAAARQLNKPWATSFINGVLRQYQRQGAQLASHLDDAARLSHPAWLLQKLQQQWPGHWRSIVEANNHPPPMTIRVNQRRYNRGDYLAQLAEADISATPCLYSPVGIRLEQPCDVDRLPGFRSGACSVQDEASQLVAPLLQPSKQHLILDSCAAPGGKTGHILELAGPSTVLDAVEIDKTRMGRVRENLDRLQMSARLIQGDAGKPEQWWNGAAYDAILLDAPCSASGVIRRHPDIKLLRKPDDLVKLPRLQRELLDALWGCLRPGGSLVFTTCSVLEEENDQTIASFLAAHQDAGCQTIDQDWGLSTRHGRQLLPAIDGTDGFYFAHLLKESSAPGAVPQD